MEWEVLNAPRWAVLQGVLTLGCCDQYPPVGSRLSYRIKDAQEVVRRSAAPQLPGSRGDFKFNVKLMVYGWRKPVFERLQQCSHGYANGAYSLLGAQELAGASDWARQ